MRTERRGGKLIRIDDESVVFEGFFDVLKAHVSFERFDGSMSPASPRLLLERGDSAAALIHDAETDELVFGRQFRYPTIVRNGPGWILEVIAGGVEAGEDPAEAVRREILEEAGYRVTRIEPIGSFYLSPGGSSERLHLYAAEVSAANRRGPGGGSSAENEDIELVRLSPAEVRAEVDAGRIVDAKTLVACLWFLDRRGD